MTLSPDTTAAETTGQAEAAALLPRIERLRHELRRRKLEVAALERITPNMLRITFTGEDLAEFPSLSPADHVKIFVPVAGGEAVMRDYTPRRFDCARRELVIDFALHEAGPATLWALSAAVGDRLEIGGPRGSQVISGPIAEWLLIGDETALPSIGRRIEEMPAGTRVTALIGVTGPAEEQVFETAAELDLRWVHRAGPTDPAPMLAALAECRTAEQCFVWIAAEAGVARALKAEVMGPRGVPGPWVKAAGYWVAGEADSGTKEL